MPNTISGVARITVDGENIYHEISATLSMELETKERETKDTSGKEYRAGSDSWTISGNGLQVEETTSTEHPFNALVTKFQAKSEVTVEFSTGTSGDYYYSGQGLITSLEVTAEVGEDPTASYTIQGTGALTQDTIS